MRKIFFNFSKHCHLIIVLLALLSLPTTMFAETQEVSLHVKRNEALRNGFTEFRLETRNNSSKRIYIEHFPSMASNHIFIVRSDGKFYPDPFFCPPKKIELFSKRFLCLFPEDGGGFLLSVAKNTARKIEGPGDFYLVFAIRKPNKKSGILLSPLSRFSLNEENEITSLSSVSLARVPQKIKNVLRIEIEKTMQDEGFKIQKTDIPF